jgi:hypothetical protein
MNDREVTEVESFTFSGFGSLIVSQHTSRIDQSTY